MYFLRRDGRTWVVLLGRFGGLCVSVVLVFWEPLGFFFLRLYKPLPEGHLHAILFVLFRG